MSTQITDTKNKNRAGKDFSHDLCPNSQSWLRASFQTLGLEIFGGETRKLVVLKLPSTRANV